MTTGNLLAGAVAGALSSALTTPFDVVKTRVSERVMCEARPSCCSSRAAHLPACWLLQMAVNLCPPGGDAMHCLVSVARSEGMTGLYAGLGFRMLYSALFTAVGFSAFEFSKTLLGVQDYHEQIKTSQQQQAPAAAVAGRK